MYHVYKLLVVRYLMAMTHKKNMRTMLIVSFISIFIATFALTLVLCIMEGFEIATMKSLQAIHADIIMQSDSSYINVQAIENLFIQEFPMIHACSPCEHKHILLCNPASNQTPVPVLLKAIDPLKELATTKLLTMMHPNHILGGTLLDKSTIVIGKNLANLYNIYVGDTVNLLIASEFNKKNSISFTPYNVQVCGILKTGIDDFDTSLVVCSLDCLKDIDPESGVSTIHIKARQDCDLSMLANNLALRTGLQVYPWYSLYPALMSALKLEKYAMTLVVSLIVLIASMNIIGLLNMLITFKRSDILILQTMGLPKKTIRSLFSIIGLIISSSASITALFCSYVTGFIVNHYQIIKLPDAYFTTHLPIAVTFNNILIVFILVVVISCCAIRLSLRTTDTIELAQLLKAER